MRKGFWMLSASAIVAGGLAWSSLNAETKRLPVKDETAPTERPSKETEVHPLSQENGDDETPKPYVRKPATPAPATPAPAKKNYRKLFGDSQEPGHLEPAEIESTEMERTGVETAGGEVDAQDDSKVIQADFRNDGRKDPIEQVAHPQVVPAPKAVDKRSVPAKTLTVPAAPESKLQSKVEPKPESNPQKYTPQTRTPAAVKLTSASQPSAPAASANIEPALVTVKWATSGDLAVGQESLCTLIVKNEGRGSALDIEVSAAFPRTVRLLKAEPKPSDSREHLAWTIPTLAAGEERQFQVTLLPMSRGDLAISASARFSNSSSTRMTVSEPELAMSVKGASSTTVGDSASQIVTVSNTGSGVARDIVLHATVPAGLESPQAKGRQIQLAIGSLAGGESRDVRLSLTAIAAGDQTISIAAKAAGNLEQETQVKVAVTAPKLEVAIAGPNVRFANRTAKYQITVTNKGAAATNNVRVQHQIPAGFDFLKADGGGTFTEAPRSVSWFVGHLEAGKSAVVHVELLAKGLGNQSHQVSVAGDSVAQTEAKLDTLIDGAAALVMEVTDLDDPVEVNTQTAYQIQVRNDGSKGAANVAVTCDLPVGVELIGVEGPTKHTAVKGKLTFAPVAELGPKKTLTYKVMVQGKAAGQLRFKSQLHSAASTEPIVVEELTRFYTD